MTKKVLAMVSFLCYITSVKFKNMKIKEVMSLSFFARRMGVNVRRLSWCIVRTENEDGEKNESPAISIKGSALCFNILQDRLEAINNVGCKTIVESAQMKQSDAGYEFKTSKGDFLITFEELQRAYESKIFSKELDSMAQRLA